MKKRDRYGNRWINLEGGSGWREVKRSQVGDYDFGVCGKRDTINSVLPQPLRLVSTFKFNSPPGIQPCNMHSNFFPLQLHLLPSLTFLFPFPFPFPFLLSLFLPSMFTELCPQSCVSSHLTPYICFTYIFLYTKILLQHYPLNNQF